MAAMQVTQEWIAYLWGEIFTPGNLTDHKYIVLLLGTTDPLSDTFSFAGSIPEFFPVYPVDVEPVQNYVLSPGPSASGNFQPAELKCNPGLVTPGDICYYLGLAFVLSSDPTSGILVAAQYLDTPTDLNDGIDIVVTAFVTLQMC
jgi:hypothetical protein